MKQRIKIVDILSLVLPLYSLSVALIALGMCLYYDYRF